jgi:hypothetical protein
LFWNGVIRDISIDGNTYIHLNYDIGATPPFEFRIDNCSISSGGEIFRTCVPGSICSFFDSNPSDYYECLTKKENLKCTSLKDYIEKNDNIKNIIEQFILENI